MAKAEFVMLAHPHKKEAISECYMSEKLDGMRIIWDGGITRGMLKSDVPWANLDKDDRYVAAQCATGLWTRYGNVIQAPDYWLDTLPKVPFDAELYSREMSRQALFGCVKSLSPGMDWKYVQAWVFDLVPFDFWLMDRTIKCTGFNKTLKGCYQWAISRAEGLTYLPKPLVQFRTTVKLLENWIPESEYVHVHEQMQLPYAEDMAHAALDEMLEAVIGRGGEGVILRTPSSYWRAERVHDLMKVKPTDDAEGTVIGYISGRQTDKGSKLLGLMGALVLRLDNGKTMELSGFTDLERAFSSDEATAWAASNPGQPCPDWIMNESLPRGARVTFRYRGTSDVGIPMEARYSRVREVE